MTSQISKFLRVQTPNESCYSINYQISPTQKNNPLTSVLSVLGALAPSDNRRNISVSPCHKILVFGLYCTSIKWLYVQL